MVGGDRRAQLCRNCDQGRWIHTSSACSRPGHQATRPPGHQESIQTHRALKTDGSCRGAEPDPSELNAAPLPPADVFEDPLTELPAKHSDHSTEVVAPSPYSTEPGRRNANFLPVRVSGTTVASAAYLPPVPRLPPGRAPLRNE